MVDSENFLPMAGIITDVQPDGVIYGVTLNDLHNYPLNQPRGVWTLFYPHRFLLTPHAGDIAMLRSAVARIRGQAPFQATAEFRRRPECHGFLDQGDVRNAGLLSALHEEY